MGGLRVIDRVTDHQGLLGRAGQGLASQQQRHGIGFFAGMGVPTHHFHKTRCQPHSLKQAAGKLGGFVGHARQAPTQGLHAGQTGDHPGVDLRMLTIVAAVVGLVTGPSFWIPRFDVVCGRRPRLLGQGGADQVLRSATDEGLNLAGGHRGQAQVLKHLIEGKREVAQGVDQGAVQIDQGRPDGLGGRVHAKAARMFWMTAR